jgi:2-dehydropantoate 2-reductase
MEEKLQPFDFIVVTTKNIPDVKPTVTDIIAPAVTPDTAIVLVQNGLNIENPILQAFPGNPVVSGVSLIGATETSHGVIRHDDSDSLIVGPFTAASESAAKRFVEIYGASGKVDCSYEPNVQFSRWNKLMYNASFNSVATILRMDTSRMRASQHVIHDLILPAMYEIRAIAKSKGIELPPNREQVLISIDPYEAFFKPSMCQDILKGNYIEFENIVGEPLREAQKAGVPAPTLKTLYGLLKGLQYATKEAKGVVVVPQTVEELQAQGGK